MKDIIEELRQLCESYTVNLQEFPNGHFRLSNHGASLDYWPNSKKRTVFKGGKRTEHVSPFDAVQMLKSSAKMTVRKPKKRPKAPPKRIKPTTTNPAGLKHLGEGHWPPWEGEPYTHPADQLRLDAWNLENRAIALKAEADELDEACDN